MTYSPNPNVIEKINNKIKNMFFILLFFVFRRLTNNNKLCSTVIK